MQNATTAAMMAYAASEDPERVPRDKATLYQPNGQPRAWPACTNAQRNSDQYFNPPAPRPPLNDR